ncbi:glycerol dehydrogenase [Turicibacter sp. HGF1]|uniref:glycerol dehydrogenase n=1 Tax=Turicibacter sp. HGF1 TaxID=910310 RepID=UPI0001FD800E|nr:glycerol dehydrogenase [Turicibacter sp. HGF1]EGC92448.1 glycerol dehydrogenase [Turicibacter sp. HGF1]
MKKVIYSPTKYIQGPNELAHICDYAMDLGISGAYVIVDPFILSHYEETIQTSFKRQQIAIHLDAFNGECSKTEINRIIENVKKGNLNVIIGIGGGKTLDTAKAVAYFSNLPVIIVPTIASTDAPCSALSVLYTDAGQFDRYLFLKTNPNVVIVDSLVIAQAPSRLLVSGMGDALATYFEARACHRSNALTIAGGTCSLAALTLAKLCYETLLVDGYQAKLSADHHVNSKALENIIEANTYLSGVGFESGGLAGAHAIHNGLTVLKESHHMYHGEKVAFGTLVQLVLENAPKEEIDEVLTFCRQLGLPTCLKDLGITNPTEDQLMAVATASCDPQDTIHHMPFEVTPIDVYSAILIADRLGAQFA